MKPISFESSSKRFCQKLWILFSTNLRPNQQKFPERWRPFLAIQETILKEIMLALLWCYLTGHIRYKEEVPTSLLRLQDLSLLLYSANILREEAVLSMQCYNDFSEILPVLTFLVYVRSFGNFWEHFAHILIFTWTKRWHCSSYFFCLFFSVLLGEEFWSRFWWFKSVAFVIIFIPSHNIFWFWTSTNMLDDNKFQLFLTLLNVYIFAVYRCHIY